MPLGPLSGPQLWNQMLCPMVLTQLGVVLTSVDLTVPEFSLAPNCLASSRLGLKNWLVSQMVRPQSETHL